MKINIWGEDSSLQDKQGHIFTTWAFKLPKFGVSEDLSDNFQNRSSISFGEMKAIILRKYHKNRITKSVITYEKWSIFGSN